MPLRDAHLQFEKWAREYGPVYSLMLGTKCLVVLSSDEAVKDLLDKRSGIYSDRQEMYIGQTLCSGNLRLLMMVSIYSIICIFCGLANDSSKVMAPNSAVYEFKVLRCF